MSQGGAAKAAPDEDVREFLPWILSFGGILLVLFAPLFDGIYHLNEVIRDLGLALLVAGAATIGIER